MKNVALIPARSGSKGIPNKNIKLLDGKPLIVYSIEAGLQAQQVERVVVSTDSEEIAEIARKAGAEVPFLRPQELAQDNTPDLPVWVHMIKTLKEEENYTFDQLVVLRPTAPFKTAAMIDQVLNQLAANPLWTSIRTVTKAEGTSHPYWMFKQDDGSVTPFVENIDMTQYYQRQLLPECYRVNGVVDILKVDSVLNNDKPYGDQIGFWEIEERCSIDIDHPFEFELCEYLMQKDKAVH